MEAFDHALLIWWRRWEDQRDIPREEKLGELGTDLGLKKINTFVIIACTKDKLSMSGIFEHEPGLE